MPNALLFESQDGGESWSPLVFPGALRAALHAFVIDPQRPEVYMAGLASESPDFAGVLRTEDGGATWRQVAQLRGRQVRALAVWRGNSQVVAAGADTGVYLSRDGGTTWSHISAPDNDHLQPIVSLAFDPKSSDTIYAGTPHLPWKTTDGGSTWRPAHKGFQDDSDILSLAVDRNRSQRLFAAACSGVYRSLNGGDTWIRLSTAGNLRTYAIVQDPQYENAWFAATSSGLFRSPDGGASWQKLTRLAPRSVAFEWSRLGRLFIASEAGIRRSDDNGKTWRDANLGLSNLRLSPLMLFDGTLYTTILSPSKKARVFRLAPGGSGLEEVAGDHVPPAFTSAAEAAKQDGWPTGFLPVPWAPDTFVASSDSGLFLSRDSGKRWERADHPPVPDPIRSVTALHPPWMAAVTAQDLLWSTDGSSWTTSNSAIPLRRVYGVAPAARQTVMVATSEGLRISEDQGASWRPLSGELGQNTIQAILRHPTRPSVWFASRYGVIYRSSDTLHAWKRISPDSWPVSSVTQFAVTPDAPDRLIVLTPQQGLFELRLEAGL
jgi:photosystem II stability/assembly factor-like uncharacterized protein